LLHVGDVDLVALDVFLVTSLDAFVVAVTTTLDGLGLRILSSLRIQFVVERQEREDGRVSGDANEASLSKTVAVDVEMTGVSR